MKNILYRFIGGSKLILACQNGADVSLALHDTKWVALHANSNTTSEHAPSQSGKNEMIDMRNNKWQIVGDQLR